MCSIHKVTSFYRDVHRNSFAVDQSTRIITSEKGTLSSTENHFFRISVFFPFLLSIIPLVTLFPPFSLKTFH